MAKSAYCVEKAGSARNTDSEAGFFGPVDLGMWSGPGWDLVRESTERIAGQQSDSKEESDPEE